MDKLSDLAGSLMKEQRSAVGRVARRTGESRPARGTVVLGFLGTTLDAGGKKRWDRWRPTVDLCRQEDLIVAELHLLYPSKSRPLCDEVVEDIRSVSPETMVTAIPFDVANPWDFEEVYDGLAAHAAARAYDPEREDLLIHISTGTHVAQICLFLLAESRHLPGRLLQTQPPLFGEDGPGRVQVIDLDLSRYDRIVSRQKKEHQKGAVLLKAGIATRNKAFNGRMASVEVVATRSKAPLLLGGPTGAGKTQLARRIFELKKARHLLKGTFVEVNCATITGDGAMSALFGHVKGAFTGAVDKRAGLLKAADGGMLFLDEIGELGLDEQAMLLRALEDKRFLPVGSDVEMHSDFALVAGTNRDLQEAARAGRFRDDLLARINLWTFSLPPLRERKEDIEPNIEVELARVSALLGRQVAFTADAKGRYLAFACSPEALWAGNFRELGASIERLATLADGRVHADAVDGEVGRLRSTWGKPAKVAAEVAAETDALQQLLGSRAADLDRFDRVQLSDVVSVCRASRSLSEAGRTLFSESRKKRTSVNDADRLRKYLASHGLSWDDLSPG